MHDGLKHTKRVFVVPNNDRVARAAAAEAAIAIVFINRFVCVCVHRGAGGRF